VVTTVFKEFCNFFAFLLHTTVSFIDPIKQKEC
jgi:hypothetical protein